MKPLGLLLTGGGSRRMGRDKATIDVDGVPLARRVGSLLAAATEFALEVGPSRLALATRVRAVPPGSEVSRLPGSGPPALLTEGPELPVEGLSGLDVVEETPRFQGPLCAVVAGWRALVERTGEKRPVIVLACDLPDITAALLEWLGSYPGDGIGPLASVVPVVDGSYQYLCARWSVADCERAVSQFEEGERSLKEVFGPDALFPAEDVWGAVASPDVFGDVDTPEDLIARSATPPPEGQDWYALTRHTISVPMLSSWVARPECGAVVSFSGIVRDHAEGRPGVEELTYEAYEDPALEAMAGVIVEARRRWPEAARIAVVHRLGRLAIGDTAVAVAVSAPHRAQAFEAASFVIDTVKEAVPIWKYERWAGDGEHPGGEGWGTCAHPIRRLA